MTFFTVGIHAWQTCIYLTLTSLKSKFFKLSIIFFKTKILFCTISIGVNSVLLILTILVLANKHILQINLNFSCYFDKTPYMQYYKEDTLFLTKIFLLLNKLNRKIKFIPNTISTHD